MVQRSGLKCGDEPSTLSLMFQRRAVGPGKSPHFSRSHHSYTHAKNAYLAQVNETISYLLFFNILDVGIPKGQERRRRKGKSKKYI